MCASRAVPSRQLFYARIPPKSPAPNSDAHPDNAAPFFGSRHVELQAKRRRQRSTAHTAALEGGRLSRARLWAERARLYAAQAIGQSARRTLVQLDTEALRRAARFPFLIVDVYFIDEAWWLSVPLNPQGLIGQGSAACLWTPEAAQKLTSEALVFAWRMARWDRRVARLVLGMVHPVVEVFRELTPQELDAISGLQGRALRLRWQEDQEFCTRLVRAARDGDGERWRTFICTQNSCCRAS
jgi:hypothetical protein